VWTGGPLPSVTKADHCDVTGITFGLIMKHLSAVIRIGRKKGKAVPVTGLEWPGGFKEG
jgi:hypothetical protein